jgi:tryptophan halogenase
MSDIEEVLVVGGGDIGLLTALSVRKLTPDLSVTVVDDFDADPPEVGKSTFREIVDVLHGLLDIPLDRFLREAKPLWKGSVYFRDWCGREPFHYPFDDAAKFPGHDTPNAVEQYALHYHELADDADYLTADEAMVEGGKAPIYYDPGQGGYTTLGESGDQWAYHLDLRRFNAFLHTLCEERGVSLVDDEVTGVDTDGTRIERVRGGSEEYEADLYVDASGFNRVLKDRLDDEFQDFALPLDAALNAKVERPLSEAVCATVIESGEHGWFWQIDTYEFRDMGYVYASEFVEEADAAAEFVAHCDDDVAADELTAYEFESGYYATPWQGNCVTIGNAVGFVEPLQSTGLTANAMAARELANLLASFGTVAPEGARDLYNGWVERLWESIYDFVSVHYRHAPGDTAFWEAAREIPATDRVECIEAHFDRNGYDIKTNPLSNRGGASTPDTLIFPILGFYTIMRNMGTESAFYEDNDIPVSEATRAELDRFYDAQAETVEKLLTPEEVYAGLLDSP